MFVSGIECVLYLYNVSSEARIHVYVGRRWPPYEDEMLLLHDVMVYVIVYNDTCSI